MTRDVADVNRPLVNALLAVAQLPRDDQVRVLAALLRVPQAADVPKPRPLGGEPGLLPRR
jgi:hypothetical protein